MVLQNNALFTKYTLQVICAGNLLHMKTFKYYYTCLHIFCSEFKMKK